MADVLAAVHPNPAKRNTDPGLRTLTLISVAHWVSHFHILVLPMLFPFLTSALHVDYVQLGFALTVFAVVSALTQAPIGYLVDHVGARNVLLIGLCIGGAALVILGLHLNYTMLIVSSALLGLANSVYHPADYAILAAHMGEAKMGRAFAIHTFSGYLGSAVAPAIVAALVSEFGGVGALIASGAIALAVALGLVVFALPDASAKDHQAAASGKKPSLLTPALMVLTVFFMLLGLSNAGISNFGVVALMGGYGASFPTANLALTAYLGAAAAGVLAGGYLADHITRHGQVAAVCFGINTIIVLLIALVALPPVLLFIAMTAAGFLGGMIAPSRDMLVRSAAPPGAAGRAFGIVSTGFNFSGMLSPLLFGWVMDQHMPRWVFGISALFMVLTVALTPFTENRKDAEPAT